MCGSGRAVCGGQIGASRPSPTPMNRRMGANNRKLQMIFLPRGCGAAPSGMLLGMRRCAYRVRLRRARRLQLPRLSRGGAPMPLISDFSGLWFSGFRGIQTGSPPRAARRAAAAGLTNAGPGVHPKAISAKEHPTWCSWCRSRSWPPQRGEVGGGNRGYAARQCPTASATAPHLASPAGGRPGNIFLEIA